MIDAGEGLSVWRRHDGRGDSPRGRGDSPRGRGQLRRGIIPDSTNTSLNPRGTLCMRARGRRLEHRQQTARVFIGLGPPEECIHGRTLPAMLTQIINANAIFELI